MIVLYPIFRYILASCLPHFYNQESIEFWYARELQIVLKYRQWRSFAEVISRAENACKNSENIVSDYFAHLRKMVDIGSGAEREIQDMMLSRYACYLIVQNGDSRKRVIAIGQTYFAIKTRQQELIENYDQLTEDQKRLAIRNEMISHNKSLAAAAKKAGIVETEYIQKLRVLHALPAGIRPGLPAGKAVLLPLAHAQSQIGFIFQALPGSLYTDGDRQYCFY